MSFEGFKHSVNFISGHYLGNSTLPASPRDVLECTEVFPQDMSKEKNQRVKRLVLRAWRTVS